MLQLGKEKSETNTLITICYNLIIFISYSLLLIAASEEERHGWVSQLNSAITTFYASSIGMDFQLSDMKTKSGHLPSPDKKELILLSGLEVQ